MDLISVYVEVGGEEQRIQLPRGATVADLIKAGSLDDPSLNGGTILVHGARVSVSHTLSDGDLVAYAPKSGKQG